MTDNPSRSLTRRRGSQLVKRGEPSLLRAVALEWLKTFDEDKVAEKFNITSRAVARIIAKPEIKQYLSKRMIPLENIAEHGARRLLEEALKTAFDEDVEWKERVENRKLLAKTLLPDIKKVTVEHNHYIRGPARASTIEEWEAQQRVLVEGPVVEAEVIDE